MPFKITQALLPYHKALALVVLGTLLATCTASGGTLLARDSLGGVDIATSVKRQLRTITPTTNDIPKIDGGRILSLTSGGASEAISNAISWLFKSKKQHLEDAYLFQEIENSIKDEQTPTEALRRMGLIDERGLLALDNPAIAKYEKFVKRYLKKTNSRKSAIDVMLAAYRRSDPHHARRRINRLESAYVNSGADSFGGRLYKAQLNAWREEEPLVVANELDLYMQYPYAEPEALMIWLEYMGLHLNLPTLKDGLGDARNRFLQIFGETFKMSPELLMKAGPIDFLPRSMLGWRQALQSDESLKTFALKNLAPLDSKVVSI